MSIIISVYVLCVVTSSIRYNTFGSSMEAMAYLKRWAGILRNPFCDSIESLVGL